MSKQEFKNILRSKEGLMLIFDQSRKYYVRNNFIKIICQKYTLKISLRCLFNLVNSSKFCYLFKELSWQYSVHLRIYWKNLSKVLKNLILFLFSNPVFFIHIIMESQSGMELGTNPFSVGQIVQKFSFGKNLTKFRQFWKIFL